MKHMFKAVIMETVYPVIHTSGLPKYNTSDLSLLQVSVPLHTSGLPKYNTSDLSLLQVSVPLHTSGLPKYNT